jgi:hypothetical protein
LWMRSFRETLRKSNLNGRGSIPRALLDELGEVDESQTSIGFVSVGELRAIVICQSHLQSVMEKNEFSFPDQSEAKYK